MKVWNCVIMMLFTLCTFVSCIDDSYNLDDFSSDMELNTSLVGPVGKSIITIGDLLRKLNVKEIQEDSTDGMFYFRYDTVTHIPIKPLNLELNESFSKIFEGTDDPYLLDLQNDQEMIFEEYLNFGINDEPENERIDSILLKNAELEIKLNTNIPNLSNVLSVEMIFPEQMRFPDGHKSVLLNPAIGVHKINMDNCFVDFSQGVSLPFKFKAKVISSSELKLDQASVLEILCRFKDEFSYEKIWGKFGNFEPQTEKNAVAIDLFEELETENVSLRFVDPKIYVSANTNIGVPTLFRIDYIRAKSSTDGIDDKYASFGQNEYSYEIPFSFAENETDYHLALADTFDNTKGNIGSLLDISPDSLEFQYSLDVGKGDSENNSFFITDDAFFDLNLSVEIPAWFRRGTFIQLTDTIYDIDLGEIVEKDFNLDRAVVDFELKNGLPFDVNVELQFLGEENEVYFLINNPDMKQLLKVDAAEVNPLTFKVGKQKQSAAKLELNKSMIEDVKKIKHLQVLYRIDASSQVESVKVTGKDFLQVSAKFYIKGGVKL